MTHCIGIDPAWLMMTDHLEFFVAGLPKQQGSKRAFVHSQTGKAIMVDACAGNKDWRQDVGHEARTAYPGEPTRDPVALTIQYVFPRPKAHYRANGELKPGAERWKASKPDLDKLDRSILDALTHIVYHDDSQVVVINSCKVYTGANWGNRVGARIVVERLG